MVHQYKLNGYNIVLDENSGAVHVVDDLVYEILERKTAGMEENRIREALLKKYPEEEITEASLSGLAWRCG